MAELVSMESGHTDETRAAFDGVSLEPAATPADVPGLSIEAALGLLHEPGSTFEVRIPRTAHAGVVSGYFDDPMAAATAITKWDGKADGVYVTLNPVNPALMARSSNHLRERARETTSDADVLRRRLLLIDVDFHRAAGISATDEELKAAGRVARRVKAHLESECGWPEGGVAHSGNGVHLFYRIDLPNDIASRDLVKRVLAALAARFDDSDGVMVDTSVHNAARIVKVPGTWACKGDNLEERPHRQSKILRWPDEMQVVSLAALIGVGGDVVAAHKGEVLAGGNGHEPFDVEGFMARNGLAIRKHKQDGSTDLWELKVCPFNPEHDQGEAFITRNVAGALLAGCHHNSCRWWRWHDLRDKFEPEYREKQIEWQRQREAALAKDVDSDQKETPELCTGEACIDWSTFWDAEDEAEWVYPDVLARGRGHALYASHKMGKSLLMLYIAAKLATGPEPNVVIYLDYEMTRADVRERLDDMGYGPRSDLARLRYDLLPTLPALDTAAGATALMAFVDRTQGEWPGHHVVVLVDTMSRAVAGAENDADTFRNFYNHTGIELKRRGATWARSDHSGKDPEKGQRGSSSKGDDVDLVWKLTQTQSGVCLHRDAARMSWVPEKVTLGLFENPLRYLSVVADWPAGTAEIAHLLTRIGVPLSASVRTAMKELRAANEGRSTKLVSAAVRWRHEPPREA